MKNITITIEQFNEDDGSAHFVASISEPEYAGTIECAATIPDCLREIATSIEVLHAYRNKIIQ